MTQLLVVFLHLFMLLMFVPATSLGRQADAEEKIMSIISPVSGNREATVACRGYCVPSN